MNKGKGRATEMDDGLYQERLQTFLDKGLKDLRTFADREGRPFEEVRKRVAQWHSEYLFNPTATSSAEVQERILDTLRSTSKMLESLQELAGLQSFFLVVNPRDPEDEGFLGGTVLGREFWRGHRGCGAAGAEAFRTQCVKANTSHPPLGSTAPHLPVQMLNVKSQRKGPANSLKMGIYADVRNAIRAASGIRNAEMKWSDHSRLSAYGVRIVGWPEGVPMRNPSTLSVAQNGLVRHALDHGELHFERIGTERDEIDGLENESQQNVMDDDEKALEVASWSCVDFEAAFPDGEGTSAEGTPISAASEHDDVGSMSSAVSDTSSKSDESDHYAAQNLKKRRRTD